ncbi:SRPBCC family protein [Jiangella mangrovi]|uniref:Uncharacterized protein YndB with AHSA1/START domain n=1 Tax=Jiangella mangrovi TaxID=1524084 RepID=A0A7W9GRS0_9ACTN|nr:SRPBCC family protein [Jiangella mangrovi]MBB5788840.1 uncharacterized protein YndB with AHSA1/START domain [Jiangella mangrovi]
MIEVKRRVDVTPEQVYAVLADGWSFAGWVVGASHIRAVDPAWPAPGSRIHHSVGPWPLSIEDVTTVVTAEPGSLLELEARAWPVGAARVRIELRPSTDGHTEIRFLEELSKGPGRLLPSPLQGLLLKPRNDESLRRLVRIAEGQAS